jgi:hypothetical protein
MVSRDWAKQHIHECIVGSLCRFCPARKLGLCANKLMHWWELTGQFGFMTTPCLSVKRGGLIAAAPVRKENALPVTTGAVTAKQVNH